IEDDTIQKIHCETHDDIVVKRLALDVEIVEYVQVKSGEPDKLWSVADMCASGIESLCAKSLRKDRHKEASRFRIVTLRAVTSELGMLTYPCYGPGRGTSSEEFAKLSAAVQAKLPGLASPKGNGIDYWLEHCLWEVRHD
ncbi:dsDNA nuclease domain-containing protein, partial [Lactobacillus crispatus]|uniref:dsDNA nuclease domain-containing protein n=1 Tax=Lactobacillus crispatus TaxID=47770 RepID=UPI0014150569